MKDLKDQLDEELMVPLWPVAGRVLGTGRDATYAGAQKGDIPAVRIGRSWRVPTTWLKKVSGLPEGAVSETEARAA